MRLLIEQPQEADRLKILAAPEFIGFPIALFSRIVQIEHAGHGVHAQPVDMIFLQPEKCIRNEEAQHFVASEVEDERAPIAVLALARIGMLVESGSIEVSETVRVLREMRRHPIDDHSDSVEVALIHEIHEVVRRAESRCGREVADHLVSPRSGKRMFRRRQQFDVRIPQPLHIFDQLKSEFAISGPFAVWSAQPTLQMEFIDGHWLVQIVLAGAPLHPFAIAPLVILNAGDDGRRLGRKLVRQPVRIGFLLLVGMIL